MVQPQAPRESALFYEDSTAHLADELCKLDLLIQQCVLVSRPQRQALQGMAASRGVYISHEEVDALLGQEAAPEAEPPVLTELPHQWETLQDAMPQQRRLVSEHGPCVPALGFGGTQQLQYQVDTWSLPGNVILHVRIQRIVLASQLRRQTNHDCLQLKGG